MYIYGLIRNSKRYKDRTIYDGNGRGTYCWQLMVWDVIGVQGKVIEIMFLVIGMLVGIIFGVLFHSLLAFLIASVIYANVYSLTMEIASKYSVSPEIQRYKSQDKSNESNY